MTRLETEEVQGNVLYAYGTRFPHARYVLLRFKEGRDAQAGKTLREWLPRITFGQRPPDPYPNPDRPHVNIAFTFAGLRRLGVPDELLYAFPDDFREGARNRAMDNGDVGPNGVDHWIGNLGTGDAMLIFYAADEEAADRMVETLLKPATGGYGAFEVLHERRAALLRRRAPDDATGDQSCGFAFAREHFGFADGCSQPAIEGVHDDPVGSGVFTRRLPAWWRPLQSLELLFEDLGIKRIAKHWRPIRAGEFVLGYLNEDGQYPGPAAPLGPNGTFLVYRELQQHVEAFDAYVDAEATRTGLDAQLVRAKIVGRWPDGTPLALSPDRPQELIASSRRRANDFLYNEQRDGYVGDPLGARCPLGAHVRRANPRDGLPGGGERVMRHRIIRRGMPYGSPDDEERGLAFVCHSSSIANGFEFIQRSWCNDGAAFGLGAERDLLLQQPAPDAELSGMVVPARTDGGTLLAAPERPLVTVRGCEYLFLPSRRATEWLTTLS